MGFGGFQDFEFRIMDVVLVEYAKVPAGIKWDVYRTGRKVWGIVYIISGEIYYVYDDGTVDKLKPGDIAILPSTTRYRVVNPNDSLKCIHYVINFQSSDLSTKFSEAGKALIVHPTDLTLLNMNFSSCLKNWENKQLGYKLLVISELYQIIYGTLISAIRHQEHLHADQYIEPAVKYLTDNFNSKILLEELSNRCKLSVTHFRRLFKSVYGFSPISYLCYLRLEKAKDILVSSDDTVETIANNTGFSSANYFIRYFNQQVGMTPHQYRKAFSIRE